MLFFWVLAPCRLVGIYGRVCTVPKPRSVIKQSHVYTIATFLCVLKAAIIRELLYFQFSVMSAVDLTQFPKTYCSYIDLRNSPYGKRNMKAIAYSL
jgi:hypothetical protein